jgi:hypothetical protein
MQAVVPKVPDTNTQQSSANLASNNPCLQTQEATKVTIETLKKCAKIQAYLRKRSISISENFDGKLSQIAAELREGVPPRPDHLMALENMRLSFIISS